MRGQRSVSHLARPPGSEIRKGLLGKPIEPARFSVPLDPLVEASSLELIKPSPDFAS
jgi:hypothetical protein